MIRELEIRQRKKVEKLAERLRISRLKQKLCMDHFSMIHIPHQKLSYLEMTPEQIYLTIHKAPIKTT